MVPPSARTACRWSCSISTFGSAGTSIATVVLLHNHHHHHQGDWRVLPLQRVEYPKNSANQNMNRNTSNVFPCILKMSHQLVFIFTKVQLDKEMHFYKTSGRLRLLCFHARATRWHRPSTCFFLVEGSLTVKIKGNKNWRFWGRGTLSSCFGNTTPTLLSKFNWNLTDVYVFYFRCYHCQ